MTAYDAIVIGAGPSGTVAASYLRDRGHRVVIIEKQLFPRFVIGESLLPLSMGHWEETGLLPALMVQKYAVKRGARFIRGKEVLDLAFADNFTEGWTWTWQVPRAHFDHVLAKATEAKGIPIHYGHEVTGVELDHPDGVRVTARDADGEKEFTARFLIDSSGYGGVLVKLLGLKDRGAGNGRMAMFTHVTETDAFRSTVKDPMQISFEIVDTDLWFWVIPFSNEVTSLGFVGHQRHFDALERSPSTSAAFSTMLARQQGFGPRFATPQYLWEPKVIREYAHYNDSLHGRNYVLTGNCAGFLDPVFSSGVAFATNSGLMAAKLLHASWNGIPVDWEKDYSVPVKRGAAVFKSYIEAWYNGDLHKIFFAPDLQQNIKEQIVSVLAGYVWDEKNPFVARHDSILRTLANVVDMSAASPKIAQVPNTQ